MQRFMKSKLPSRACLEFRREIKLLFGGGDLEILGGGNGGYSKICLASVGVR